ncbi:hypothetical protein ABW21_db0209137 [Orbilia brochopaga]|nr:hypothetical protein ABW21_db0209137 [Drechslerella brochopaga]
MPVWTHSRLSGAKYLQGCRTHEIPRQTSMGDPSLLHVPADVTVTQRYAVCRLRSREAIPGPRIQSTDRAARGSSIKNFIGRYRIKASAQVRWPCRRMQGTSVEQRGITRTQDMSKERCIRPSLRHVNFVHATCAESTRGHVEDPWYRLQASHGSIPPAEEKRKTFFRPVTVKESILILRG